MGLCLNSNSITPVLDIEIGNHKPTPKFHQPASCCPGRYLESRATKYTYTCITDNFDIIHSLPPTLAIYKFQKFNYHYQYESSICAGGQNVAISFVYPATENTGVT